MNDDTQGGGSAGWIDPEVEARIVAMILGETSEFEEEQLETLIAQRPELKVFRRRLEAVHFLMGEAVKCGDCEKWRLVPERRREVLKALGFAMPEPQEVVEPLDDKVVVLPVASGRERRVRKAGVRVAWMLAACVVVSLVLAPFLMTGGYKETVESPTVVTYSAQKRSVPEAQFMMDAPASSREYDRERNGRSEFTGVWESGEAAGGGSVKDQLAALKTNLGSGGVVVDDDEPVTMDPVLTEAGLVLEHGRSTRSVADPAAPLLRMPEVGEPDRPRGPTTVSRAWKKGRVEIAGNVKTGDRLVRREVPLSPDDPDGFDSVAEELAAEPAVAFELPDLAKLVGEQEPDYDGGIAMDRRDESYSRYSSDSSLGYRWTDRLGVVSGFRHQVSGLDENGDDVVDLPDESEVMEMNLRLGSERLARNETRSMELAGEVVPLHDVERDVEDEEVAQETGNLREILQTQLNLVDGRLEKMRQVVNDRRDQAVDNALESHDYMQSKREYEQAQAMLQSMKLQQSSKRIALKIPKNPITVHEEAKAKKKSGGFLGLGAPKYEAATVVQVNPNMPDLHFFGDPARPPATSGNMTRQFFATEAEVVESEKTLEGVVDELGLEKKWGTNKAGAIQRLKDSVKTEQVRGTDLIQIKVEEKNAEEAKLIADRVAKEYQKRRTTMERDRAEKALEAIDAELREQEDLVEEKRKVLDTIVQAIGIPYVEGVRGSGEMGRSKEKIYELAERNLYELEKEKQQLEIQLKTLLKLEGKELMEYAAGLEMPGVELGTLFTNYQEAVRELGHMKARGLGAKHPDLVMHVENTNRLRAEMEKWVGSLNKKGSSDRSEIDGDVERAAEQAREKEEARRLAEAKKREALRKMEKSAAQDAFSTFSLHVSDVSFKLAQAGLAKGEWPEAERIRVEEFVNAFDYGDPAPSQDEKVACALEQAVHPFMQQRNMLRISMRTAAVGRAAGTPLRLTVLLDNSGSMERSDRAESVQRAFELLASQMNPQDEVTLISFARQPRLVRDSVPGDQVAGLVNVIRDTPSEGGTNLEEALKLGVEKAQEDFLEGAQNRIILLTDGAANLGNAEPELLGAMVEKMRQRGIAFDACGVGADGLNDDVLEALTRKGDGRYYFLDRPEDADAGFAKQIAGALRPAAKNVKVQVEFNPKRVGHYRLYGFEKHELKKEDFRDDSVDAAEMAAEEAGVAIYQVQTLPDGEGDVGSVSVRFMDMATGRMVERRWAIPYEANPARLEEALPSMKLAAAAAFLGEKLKGTPVGELVELKPLIQACRSLETEYPGSSRVGELIEMMERARRMGR